MRPFNGSALNGALIISLQIASAKKEMKAETSKMYWKQKGEENRHKN